MSYPGFIHFVDNKARELAEDIELSSLETEIFAVGFTDNINNELGVQLQSIMKEKGINLPIFNPYQEKTLGMAAINDQVEDLILECHPGFDSSVYKKYSQRISEMGGILSAMFFLKR
jgi:hypothetical protein